MSCSELILLVNLLHESLEGPLIFIQPVLRVNTLKRMRKLYSRYLRGGASQGQNFSLWLLHVILRIQNFLLRIELISPSQQKLVRNDGCGIPAFAPKEIWEKESFV